MTKIESDIQTILISQERFEANLDSHIENSITMPTVKKEITTQIKHAVTECKLDLKNSIKKPTMRDVVFVLAIVGTVATKFI